MVVEGPSQPGIVAFGAGFAYVVKQGGPPQPLVAAAQRHVVEHGERVVEVVFVSATLDGLYPFEGSHLGEDEGQQLAVVEQDEAFRGDVGADDFAQLVDDALFRDDFDARAVALDGGEGLGLDAEVELRGEPYGPHHAQGVVAEGDVGVERGADNPFFEVVHTAEGVDQFAPAVAVQTQGQGVDGEVAPVLVVLQGSVLDYRLARVVAVRLLAGADELDFEIFAPVVILHLGRTEVAEGREMGPFAQPGGERLGQFDAAAQGDDVDVFGGAVQKDVAHIAADDEAGAVHRVGHLADEVEYGLIEMIENKLIVGLHNRGVELTVKIRLFRHCGKCRPPLIPVEAVVGVAPFVVLEVLQ